MNISRGMIVKVVGGTAVAVTATTVGVVYGTGGSSDGSGKIIQQEVKVEEKKEPVLTMDQRVSGAKKAINIEGINLKGVDEDDKVRRFASLSSQELKTIPFSDGVHDLKIVTENINGIKFEMVDTKDTENFPGGLRVVLENQNNDIDIEKQVDNYLIRYHFKKKTSPEFKIEGSRLLPAWNIDNLSSKVNLECDKEKKTCSLKEGETINVGESVESNNASKLSDGVKFQGTIKYESNQEDHFQGFKFTVEGDIVLEKEGEEDFKIKKLESGDVSYQIRLVEGDDKKKTEDKWYLAKRRK